MSSARSCARDVYSHDHIATAAAVLDIVFTDRLTGWDGWGAVDNATKDVEPPLPAALVRTQGQTAARPLRLGMSGERPGCDLQLGGDVPAMPLIKDIPPDVIELWANVADHVTAPGASARLHDLLFTRRHGNPAAHARAAVGGYLNAVGDAADDLDTTTYLMRAWTLARLVRTGDLEDAVLDELDRRVVRMFDGDGMKHPGVLYPLVEALTEPLIAGSGRNGDGHINEYLDLMASAWMTLPGSRGGVPAHRHPRGSRCLREQR